MDILTTGIKAYWKANSVQSSWGVQGEIKVTLEEESPGSID